jgi:hypothetical protein
MASPLLRKFLASKAAQSFKGGRPCKTCMCGVDRRKTVEREAKVFNAARRAGSTSAPWSRFVQHVLRPIGFDASDRALTRHLRECLGWEIF